MIIEEIGYMPELFKEISGKDGSGLVPSPAWLEKINKFGSRFFVTKEGPKAIGYIAADFGFKWDKNGVEIDIVSVVEEHQGKGIGTALIEYIENLTQKSGKTSVYILVRHDNYNAISFYVKNKYTFAGAVHDRYGQGKHAIIMRKMLD